MTSTRTSVVAILAGLLAFSSHALAQSRPVLATAPYDPSYNLHTVPQSTPQVTVVNQPTPGGFGFAGGFGGFGYPGWGLGRNPGVGLGFAYQGIASMTQASGQYQQDIQQARITREQSRQAAIETARQRMQLEMEYERNRPTYQKVLKANREVELDLARRDPPKMEIWEGKTLNILLRSILASDNPVRGPNISLEPATVRGLNLTDKSSTANISMTKDEGKIFWAEAFDDVAFDTARDRFTKNYEKATKSINYGETPERGTLRDLREDLKGLETTLDAKAADFSPGKFIAATKQIALLKTTVRGLSDPRIVKATNNWRKDVNTVAELVNHCMKNGVEFGPTAATGDEAAYTATYYALRAYERGVVQLASGPR